MDIFTTQLTRVVPVPIKQEKLKVKALLKEGATRGLDEELDHLEHATHFFIPGYQASGQENRASNMDKQSGDDTSENAQQVQQVQQVNAENKLTPKNESHDKSAKDQGDDEPPHLDIFV